MDLAAKIRTLFRERQPEQKPENKLKYAARREQDVDFAVETLGGGTTGKRRLWLIPALFALSAVAVFAAVLTAISVRGSWRDTLQLRAEIARLELNNMKRLLNLREHSTISDENHTRFARRITTAIVVGQAENTS